MSDGQGRLDGTSLRPASPVGPNPMAAPCRLFDQDGSARGAAMSLSRFPVSAVRVAA